MNHVASGKVAVSGVRQKVGGGRWGMPSSVQAGKCRHARHVAEAVFTTDHCSSVSTTLPRLPPARVASALPCQPAYGCVVTACSWHGECIRIRMAVGWLEQKVGRGGQFAAGAQHQ